MLRLARLLLLFTLNIGCNDLDIQRAEYTVNHFSRILIFYV